MHFACAVCKRQTQNKTSVRYEVIAGIISLVNQRFSGRAGGEEGGGLGGESKKTNIQEKKMKDDRA